MRIQAGQHGASTSRRPSSPDDPAVWQTARGRRRGQAAPISIAIAINVALYGAVGPFAAAFMEQLGVRRMILIALALMAVSTVASTFVMTPAQLAPALAGGPAAQAAGARGLLRC